MSSEPYTNNVVNKKRRTVFMVGGKQAGAASSVPPADGSCEGFVLTCVDGVPTWVAPSPGLVLSTTTTISNATLRTTSPTTLVAAQGAGTVVQITEIDILLNYGGTNAFTTGGGVGIKYNNNASATITSGGYSFSQSADSLGYFRPPDSIGPFSLTLMENQPVTFNIVTALAGNAANDNTVAVVVYYQVLAL